MSVSHRLEDGLMITAEGVHLCNDHHCTSGWQCREGVQDAGTSIPFTLMCKRLWTKVCRYVQQDNLQLGVLTAGLMGLVTSEVLDLDSKSNV